MSSFDSALETVHDSLKKMRVQGKKPRASAKALAALVEGTRKKPETKTPAASKPELPKRELSKPNPPVVPVVPVVAPAIKLSAAEKAERIEALRTRALSCQKCPHLVRSRTQVVFGVGNPHAELMFVGEAPGADEDLEGEPFVGKAGQLLTKIIETMGFSRSEVYIANILKCRPDMPEGASGNRRPTGPEMETCLPYLKEQISIIQPRVLVALGAVAMEGLLADQRPMRDLRGRWHEFNGIPLMATYHPAYLLRNQSLGEKRKVWEDMLQVLERLEHPISDKQRGYFLSK